MRKKERTKGKEKGKVASFRTRRATFLLHIPFNEFERPSNRGRVINTNHRSREPWVLFDGPSESAGNILENVVPLMGLKFAKDVKAGVSRRQRCD